MTKKKVTREYDRIPQGEKAVWTHIPEENHFKLKSIAKDRDIFLRELTGKVLSWASEKSPQELIEVGVDLPVYKKDK